MKLLTALAVLSAVLALAPAARAQFPVPRSTLTAPATTIAATDGPVPVDLTVALPGFDINDYTYSGFVAVAPLPVAYDFIDRFPLSGDPANPAHWTGTASDGLNDDRWASRPGTYFVGVEAFAKPTGPYCTTDAATAAVTCAQAAFADVRETPLHEVVVVARLDATHAKIAARRRAARIGWRSKAPLTCVAPFAPSAFACTFTWHVRGKAVHRSLTVAQTATGTITIARAS